MRETQKVMLNEEDLHERVHDYDYISIKFQKSQNYSIVEKSYQIAFMEYRKELAGRKIVICLIRRLDHTFVKTQQINT